MRTTLSYYLVTVVAGAAIAAGGSALASQQGAGTIGRPAGDTIVQEAVGAAAQAAAVRYWTPARMAGALRAANGSQPTAEKPGSHARRLVRNTPPAAPGPWPPDDTAGNGLAWTHGGSVAAAVGKIFFTLADEDYVCSGTLVGGKRVDVVLTAAHCVTSGPGRVRAARSSTGPANTGQWATNWMFVPGFRDGLEPYGEYTARRFFVIPDWTGPEGGREQYDVAFVQVTTATLDQAAGAAQPPTGLPVEFAASRSSAPLGRAFVFGYPAEPPYSGFSLSYCAGPAVASAGRVRTPCGMTAGDSGGPWLAGFGPHSSGGTVVAVSTYKISSNLKVLYGAALGPQARALYERAVRSARLSAGPARSPSRSVRPPNARSG